MKCQATAISILQECIIALFGITAGSYHGDSSLGINASTEHGGPVGGQGGDIGSLR